MSLFYIYIFRVLVTKMHYEYFSAFTQICMYICVYIYISESTFYSFLSKDHYQIQFYYSILRIAKIEKKDSLSKLTLFEKFESLSYCKYMANINGSKDLSYFSFQQDDFKIFN